MSRRPDHVNLFLVGAARCGTTSLYRALVGTKEVYGPEDELYKEPAYFCDKRPFKKTEADYHSLYASARDAKYLCDASTCYLTCPTSAKRIHEYNPESRILISLRDPVDRAYSLYKWMVSEGYELAPSFRHALDRELSGASLKSKVRFPEYRFNYLYLRSGCYVEQIERYLALFGAQVRLVRVEEFEGGSRSSLDAIAEWLDVGSIPDLTRDNASRAAIHPTLSFACRYLTNQALRVIPRSVVQTKARRDVLVNAVKRRRSPPKISGDDRQYVRERFGFDREYQLLEKEIFSSNWI